MIRIFTLLLSLSVLGLNAATFNTTGASTSWNSAIAWTIVTGTDANGIPDIDDDVVILNGHSITLSTSSYANSLTINSGGTFTPNLQALELKVNFTNNGTVSGKMYLNFFSTTASISTLNLTSFSTLVTSSSTLTINAGSIISVSSFQVKNSSTVNNNGNASISVLSTTNTIGNTWNNLSGSTLNLDQNLPYSIGFSSATNSKVAFFTSVTSIPNWTYYNFALSGSPSTKTVSAALTINGTATIKSGNVLNMNNNMLNLGGDLSNSGTISNLSTLNLNGSSNQTLSSSSAISIATLNATNTNTIIINSGTYNISSSATFAKNLTINSGSTLNLNSHSLSLGGDLSNSGTLSNLATVNLNGSSNQTLSSSSAISIATLNATNTNTIIISTGTYNISSSATFAKNLTINSGSTLNLNSHSFTLGGDLSNSGTLSNLATVNLNGSTNQTLVSSSALTMTNFNSTNTNTVILSTGTYNVSAGTLLNSGLTINSGVTLNLNSVTLNLAGSLSNSGTISNLTDVNLNGTSAQTISSSQSLAFDDLTCANSAGITVMTGTHTINNSLTVSTGNFDAGSGLVTLTSDATKTAYIANSAGTISGSMVIQRFVSARPTNYHDFSSSVTNTTINDWDDEMYMSIGAPDDTPGYPGGDGSSVGFQSVFTYNNATAGYDPVTTGTTLTVGLGYDIYLGDNATSWPGRAIDTRGTPNMGSKSLPVVFGADGWNLVGNPHAAFIDWSTVVSASTQLDATVYMLDNSGNYQSYTNPVIAPGQGFFCYINNGTGTAIVDQNAKTTSTSSTFNRLAAMPENGLRLRLSSSANPYYHEIELFFDKKSATGFEKGKDMPFFKSRMTVAPNITFMDGTTRFTRNYVSSEANILTIPLELNTPVDGNYTVDLEGLYASNEYAAAYLVNTVTNEQYEIHDGKPATMYFSADAPRSNFNLVLTRIAAAGTAIAANETVSIFSTSETINIKGLLETNSPAKVEVFNLMGQLVLEGSAEMNGAVNTISTQTLNPNMYIVKVTTADNRQFSKKIAVTK